MTSRQDRVNQKGQGARAVTYKDQLEKRKNARKHAQHQNQQEQPAKLASRKKDLLAHLEENIRDRNTPRHRKS